MKKVLLSAYACSPVRGSEPGCGWSWAVNIAKIGYEVWCITNNEDKEIIETELKKQGLKNLHFVFITVPYGLDTKLLDTSSKKIYLHYYLWRKAAAKVAIKLHETQKFDIAHHVTFASLQQGTFLWRLNNVKLIFGPVGGGQKAFPAFKEYIGKAWRIEVIRSIISSLTMKFNSDLRKTLEVASHIFVANKDTEDLIKSTSYYNSSKVSLLLDNAVPPSMTQLKYTPKVYGKKTEFLWVGRMLPRKGLNLVLHALSFLDESMDYNLTIVGGGEQFHLLGEWIEKYNINPDKLTILGQIPFLDVIKYYQKAEVFVFCSLRESGGAQLNEAMAFGLPPIVLDIHGAAVTVPENCGIKVKATFPEETAKGIAAAMTRLGNDKELLAHFSKAAYEYAQKNTWEQKVKILTENYY